MIPGLVRHVEMSRRSEDRYSGWIACVGELQADLREGEDVGLEKISGYLKGMPESDRDEAIEDLVAAHLSWSWSNGCGACLEAYVEVLGAAFDALSSIENLSVDLVEDEFLARYQEAPGAVFESGMGEDLTGRHFPGIDEYAVRFKGRPDIRARLKARVMGDGRYVRLKKIGRGAMGVIWAAYDREGHERVAIKEPSPQCADDPGSLSHFAQEARVSIDLKHPGIINVDDYQQVGAGAEGDFPFCVMRLAEGEHLGEKIRAYHRPRTERTVAETQAVWRGLLHSFVEICDAMTYAHGCGVAHRDLKPGNVMVDENGCAAILDWGMGAVMHVDLEGSEDHANDGAVDSDAVIAGTPEYMAPEQAAGAWGIRSEVFGLGGMLYEMLTERSPYDWVAVGRPDDWRESVLACRIDHPRSIKSRAPHELVAICMKALAADPVDRYANAEALADAVRDYLEIEALGWGKWRRWVKGFGGRSGGAGIDKTRNQSGADVVG